MFGLAAILMVGSLLSAGKLRAQQAPPPQPASTSAATAGGETLQSIDFSRSRVFVPYHAPEIPEISMSNSERLHSLIANGKMELSLDDAIALALENNLDIALSRYSLIYAKVDILRTKAGGAILGINPGLFGAVTAFGSTGAGGGGGGTGGAGGFSGGASAVDVGNWGCCDPVAGVAFGWGHASSPLDYTTLAGVPVSTTQATSMTAYMGKGFLTGTSVAAFVSGNRAANNQLGQLFNPATAIGLTLGFWQPLLSGFGYRANAKYIRIARNDLKQADSVFKQQVITTVANVANLYSDLVSFKEGVRVAEQTLASAQKLLSDNKRQVEIGTLAPIEVVRAESEVASDEQALIVAQTQYQQQQELLKTAISKHVDAELTAATVEPTDKLPEPRPDDIPPLETALREAEANRPELVQRELDIRNQEITVQTARNGLLPSLNLFGTWSPSGLSGNSLVCPQGDTLAYTGPTMGQCLKNGAAVAPAALVQNGIWTSLSQSFRGVYPYYSFGVNLQVPIRNRQAQAAMTVDLLQQRQLRVQMQQQKNTIAQDVRNQVIAVTQARAQVAAAVKATQLQQETLDAEQKKFQLGESTVYNVILTQRDLATAEGNEVKARSTYAKALTTFAQSTATILDKYSIEMADAKNARYHTVPNIPGTSEYPAPTSFTPAKH